MWLAARYGAGKARMPSDALLVDQLGSGEDARLYKKLVRDYPEIERGPDQEIAEHYNRLKSAFEKENVEVGEGSSGAPKPRGVPKRYMTFDDPDYEWPTIEERTEPRNVPMAIRTPEELAAEQGEGVEPPPPPANDLPRRVPRNRPLAPRDPGWYVSPESESAGYGVPPMPRRTPGDSMRPSSGPGYAPPQKSMDDWINWLRSKGIEIDPTTLQRPDAVRTLPPPRPRALTGPEIWMPFVNQSGGDLADSYLRDLPESAGGLGKSWKQRFKDLRNRRRASAEVVDYIEGVLVKVAADVDEDGFSIPGYHTTMMDDDWGFHGAYPGQFGSWYHKPIGDRIHVIVNQGPGDWLYNSAPVGSEPNEYDEYPVDQNPQGFTDLRDAVLHANRGQQIGIRARPISPTSPSWN